jgi:cytochrome c-type biogenesis protein
METPTLLVAFIGGLILFASPCVAPLIPAYMASISGVRLSDLQQESRRELQVTILKNSLFFILGFSVVFILLGTFIGFLSSQIAGFQVWLNRIGGALVIVLAFHMLGLIKIPLLERGATVGAPSGAKGYLKTALMGLSFGVSWTPCTGPVLGAIFALSATTASLVQSATLMTAFSLGLAVPFLLTGLFTVGVAQFFARSPHILKWVNIIGGIFLLFLGVFIFTGRLQWLFGLFYGLIG